MAARSFLLLHGWQGSGPDHWQTWLAARLRAAGEVVAYPDLPEPDRPQLEPWLAALRAALAPLPGIRTVVCHSLGCLLWVHHAARRPGPEGRAARVLLVAPPCESSGVPEVDPFLPVPADSAALRAASPEVHLVCSDDDPYCPGGAHRRWASALGLTAHLIPGGGHLNPDAGLGPWPAVERWSRGETAAPV